MTGDVQLELVQYPELDDLAQERAAAEIDRLMDDHTNSEIADILNAGGLRPGVADRFTSTIIYHIRHKYGLENHFSRLRRTGLLTLDEIAAALDLNPATVKDRAARGQLVSYVYNDKGQRLYAPPGEPPVIACAYCGTPILERGKHGQKRKYCKVSCCTSAYARRRGAAGWVRHGRG